MTCPFGFTFFLIGIHFQLISLTTQNRFILASFDFLNPLINYPRTITHNWSEVQLSSGFLYEAAPKVQLQFGVSLSRIDANSMVRRITVRLHPHARSKVTLLLPVENMDHVLQQVPFARARDAFSFDKRICDHVFPFKLNLNAGWEVIASV